MQDPDPALAALLDRLAPAVVASAVRDAAGAIVDFRIAYANASAIETVGLPPDDAVGQTWSGSMVAQAAPDLFDCLVAVVEDGEPFVRTVQVPRAGAGRVVEARFERFGDGILAVGSDVTDAVRAHLALEEERERYALLANLASDFVVELGADWTITWISESVTGYSGWLPSEVVGRSAADFWHADDMAAWTEFVATVTAAGQGRCVQRLAARNGEWWWVTVNARARYGPDGEVVGFIGSGIDSRAEIAAREALADSESRFRLVAEHAADVVLRADADSIIRWASPSVAPVLGWAPEEVVGHPTDWLAHPDELPTVLEARRLLAQGIPMTTDSRVRTADGGDRWMSVRVEPVLDAGGTTYGRVIALRDIEATVEALGALRESEERFRSAMQSAPIGMALLDLDRRFLAVNPALCAMLGHDEAWLLAHRVPDLLDEVDDRLDLELRAGVLERGDPSAVTEHRLRAADGSEVWVEHSIAALHDHAGAVTGFVAQFVDVTDAVRARIELAYQATHDPLTHVANRADLHDHIDRLRRQEPRLGSRVGVLFIDVDRLKRVNDRHGHAAGDAVLVTVADRIRGQVRTDDVVARFGGDEFVVVLPTLHDVGDAEAVAEKIMASMAEPVRAEGVDIPMTVSIGVALARDDLDADATLRQADAALYDAKRAGRDTVAVYRPGTETAGAPGA